MYDVVVIGAGPGGMTAALYTARSNLKTLLLERGIPGGQLNNTAEIENYTGFSSIMGPILATDMYEQVMKFGIEYDFGAVKEVVDRQSYKEVHAGNKIYRTRTVIIATGAEHRKLDVPGEAELNGRGVSYCAVCDGAFFKDEPIVVIGGGDSAVEEGNYLTQFANKVTIIHRRDELRAKKILQERAFQNEKINFVWDTVVERIEGKQSVEAVIVRNVKTGEVTRIATAGVFIYVGLLPNSEPFLNLGITDAEGWIITDETMATKIPGIFAIGDVRQTVLRQIATAVGDGAIAGDYAFKYIETLN
ncbi:thioredoxin-disulfide reductase [Allofustis seminis]|uniref:thioredoxin-disulfide reductase n=1 Tax=Allofustis seminis TaxID=166939 RepID=UPI000475FBD5|nr:thioredoxin-disulfide reductase [Allofustis seminis]